MLAAKTTVPVLGVPVQSKALNGMDSLLSIVQMPAGIPVATFAIGNAGASNAALFAAALLAVDHADVAESLSAIRQRHRDEVAGNDDQRDPIRRGRDHRRAPGLGSARPPDCTVRCATGAAVTDHRHPYRSLRGTLPAAQGGAHPRPESA